MFPILWRPRRQAAVRPFPPGAASDLAVDSAIAGIGIVALFRDWLQPHFDSGFPEPVLEPWWERFTGPYLYYPGRRFVPTPLRAFVDFVKASADRF
jgi:DNA-binding transcriptional LysR family regulator